MGHCSWLTFTRTAKEANALVKHLTDVGTARERVGDIAFILILWQPYEGDKPICIGWSGDGLGSREEAEAFVQDTHMLDTMPLPWKGDLERFGHFLPLELLEFLVAGEEAAANDPQPNPPADRLTEQQGYEIELAGEALVTRLVKKHGVPADRIIYALMFGFSRVYDGDPVDFANLRHAVETFQKLRRRLRT